MKTKTAAAIILGALALSAFGATAQAKPHSDAQLRQLSRTFGQLGPRVTVDVSRVPATGGTYESYSLGRQSYPNPDRGPYPAPCGTGCF
jgi:ABC-type glycerol-3-phosphate transport system substrate-binding protein